VILFVRDLPFWPPDAPLEVGQAINLPIIPTDPGRAPPTGIRPFQWRFDSACTSDGFAQPPELLESGLSTSQDVNPDLPLRTASGQIVSQVRRPLDLWLVSNIPALMARPFLIPTGQGIHVGANMRVPMAHFPVIGVRALRRAGVRVLSDFQRNTVSVWIPSSMAQTAFHRLGRALGLRRSATVRWAHSSSG